MIAAHVSGPFTIREWPLRSERFDPTVRFPGVPRLPTWYAYARHSGHDQMEKMMASFAIPQGSECPYWSHGDESAFFRWLGSIPGVESVKGHGLELIVTLRSSRISSLALRELIALHTRYNLPMQSLAQFETAANKKWFRSKKAYWYSKVFR